MHLAVPLDHLHERVAIVALAAVEGLEVRCCDGMELTEIVGGGPAVHDADGFGDLGLICQIARASRRCRGRGCGKDPGDQDGGEWSDAAELAWMEHWITPE
jgi:hypothetical protein